MFIFLWDYRVAIVASVLLDKKPSKGLMNETFLSLFTKVLFNFCSDGYCYAGII